ncbi:hypothetical protein J6590_001784 [Homalodisca vitripennis]|nr:hypothetical protein J6590_001784 [Homalodisca vitripennis]
MAGLSMYLTQTCSITEPNKLNRRLLCTRRPDLIILHPMSALAENIQRCVNFTLSIQNLKKADGVVVEGVTRRGRHVNRNNRVPMADTRDDFIQRGAKTLFDPLVIMGRGVRGEEARWHARPGETDRPGAPPSLGRFPLNTKRKR